MNKILNEIRKITDDNMALYLPHVKAGDLEKKGAFFYMNAKDGTEFDWYVNDKLPPFMMFYDDKDNLGAAKLTLRNNGQVELYFYGEKGKKLLKEVDTNVNFNTEEILELAATLRNEADNKEIWDADIEDINTDAKINNAVLNEFKDRQKDYTTMRNRRDILNLKACVSREIVEDGWKIGFMERMEPENNKDSGWFFASGNETGELAADKIMLLNVGLVWQRFDSDILQYIDMPVGTRLIRISPDSFEIDKNDKPIFTVKR